MVYKGNRPRNNINTYEGIYEQPKPKRRDDFRARENHAAHERFI